jgi:deoxycytidine triphosphate deaminase
MVLGHSIIIEYIREKKLIENVEEKNVEGSGVDLRAKTFYKLRTAAEFMKDSRKLPEITEVQEDVLVLKPGEYVLVETVEKVNMPEDLCALMSNRSSLFRCGASLRTAVIDPGYIGTLTFGLKNESQHELTIEKGARIGQIQFFRVEGATKLYEGRYQGGKVV